MDGQLTPREFVRSRPEPLEGFEESANFIAELLSYSEFSGEPVPDSKIPELKEFWTDLTRRAREAA